MSKLKKFLMTFALALCMSLTFALPVYAESAQTEDGNAAKGGAVSVASVETDDDGTWVDLTGNAKEGFGFKINEETHTACQRTDSSADNYVENEYVGGHIQIAQFETPVALGDGIAFKMARISSNLRFVFGVIDSQGDIFIVRPANEAAGLTGYYTYKASNGEKQTIQVTGYTAGFYHTSGSDGTIYVPYSAFGFYGKNVAIDLPFEPVGTADSKLTDIKSVFVSLDMINLATASVVTRHLAVSAVANVYAAEERADIIADLTAYTCTEDAAEEGYDVNLSDPAASKIVRPISKADFVNKNWVVTKAEKTELVSFAGIAQPHVGDVKVLHDFELNTEEFVSGFTSEELDLVMQNLVTINSGSDVCEVGHYDRGNGNSALLWTIGDALDSVQSHNQAILEFGPAAGADEWSNWQGAKGFSLFVKNLETREVSFNVQVVLLSEQDDGEGGVTKVGTSYRYSDQLGLVYFYDTVRGIEYASQTSTVRIVIPAGFEGYLRIPFDSYALYSASGDTEMDLSKEVSVVYLRSELAYNSNARIVLDDLGVYSGDFGVKSVFRENKGIADCMYGEDSLS